MAPLHPEAIFSGFSRSENPRAGHPGIDYMHAMIGSTFINRIGAGKQLGDTLAVASIPVLSELDRASE